LALGTARALIPWVYESSTRFSNRVTVLIFAAVRKRRSAFMSIRISLLGVVLACTAACTTTENSSPGQPVIAIVGATIVYPERDAANAVLQDGTLVISGKRIQAAGPSAATPVPKNATVIDGRGKWVIPGLIDSHVHFFQSGNLYTRPDVADFNAWMPYTREVERNKARLPATFKVWLASGVTSVVDVGGPFWNFDVRDAAAKTAAAPRVAVAGPLISMIDRPKLDLGDPPIIKIDSAESARALVQRELARKPDYIKVWFIHQPGDDLTAQEAIVKATVDAAHAAGVRVAVHATELVVAKAALRAGADFLVHSVEDVPVDQEFLALAKKNRILYCPTLFVYQGYGYALSGTWKATPAERRLADPQTVAALADLPRIPKNQIPEIVANRLSGPAPALPVTAMANLRTVWDAGITVVMGTDAGNIGTLHGPSVFREMALMQLARLTPLQVLRSATVNGARATGKETELGTIAPGKLADLVILEGDPLAGVDNLSRVYRVIKDGHVYDPDELIQSIR
jgi:imidazolonepropionase-like amidohydrolase